MFGLFGKKAKAQPIDDALRIIPQDLWDGSMGQALRDAGMSPDDASNLLDMNPVDARIAKARFAHEEWLAAESNARGGARLATQFILTDDVWNGPHVELLLYTLALTPYERWNVRLVAADHAAARQTGLPRFYAGQIPQVVEAANRHISELSAEARALTTPDQKHALTRELAGLTNYYWEELILPGLLND